MTRTMNTDIRLSKLLGGLSLCLGTVQLMAPRRIEAALGLGLPSWVMRLLGVRELASGFATLAHPDVAPPVGLRLAGDALDLAAGVSLRRRRDQALATARRTRVA